MPYDIHFQPVPADEAKSLKVYTFGFEAALKVRGPQALVNRWAKTFLTPLGSDPRDLGAGTEFARIIGGNFSLRSPEMQDVIVIAIEETNDQVRQQDLDGHYDADEMLETATLKTLQVSSQGDGIDVWIEIYNREEQRLTVYLANMGTR